MTEPPPPSSHPADDPAPPGSGSESTGSEAPRPPHQREVDGELFVRLLTRHENDIYRSIVALMPGRPEIDDVMQETAALLWKKFADYDASQPFLPWARRFALFEVLKWRQRLGRSKLIFNDDLVHQMAAEQDAIQPELEQRRKALDTCLAKLGQRERQLLRQRYQDGLTVMDLATSEGVKPHKLYYALEKIRRQLLACIEATLKSGRALPS